jgi:hypothetical protein
MHCLPIVPEKSKQVNPVPQSVVAVQLWPQKLPAASVTHLPFVQAASLVQAAQRLPAATLSWQSPVPGLQVWPVGQETPAQGSLTTVSQAPVASLQVWPVGQETSGQRSLTTVSHWPVEALQVCSAAQVTLAQRSVPA